MSMINLMFEVTQSCNCDCVFCYNVWKGKSEYPKGSLSLDQIKMLFDNLFIGLPAQSIFLSGGEPLLRDDLEDIVVYLKSKKLFVGICTNGLLLTPKKTNSLIEAGVDQFEITLLSADPNVHNTLSGCPVSFESACEAVANVLQYKANLRIAFVATRQNIHSVGEVIDCVAKMGVKAFAFYRFTPTGKGIANHDALMPTQEQLNNAMDVMDAKADQWKVKINLGIHVEPCLLKKNPKNIFFTYCQAGSRKLTIDSLGNLRLCEQDSRILGNLFQKNMAMLILKEKFIGPKRPLMEDCRNCSQRNLCRGGCKFLCDDHSSGRKLAFA